MMATERLSVSLTSELKKRIVKESEKNFGKRRGALGMYVEQVMRLHYGMNLINFGVVERE